jgi:dTDP-4-dehydrorhamnose reductase
VKVLVTGAAGMLGTDTVRSAEEAGHDVVSVAHEDLDVTDAGAVERLIAAERPEALVNCAAWTDVDGAEEDLEGAMDVNAVAAGTLAAAAAAVGCKVIYPSTDYVFDGTNTEPYVESDQVRPLSVYGQSKLAGEVETAKENPRHFIVRSSWLFGTAGRNFVETMLTFASDHGEVVVVKDQVGSPTYTGHLAEGLVRLLDWEEFGVHHIAADGQCSWYEFALEIFEQAGVECKALSATTDMLGRKAPRPAYSVLGTERTESIRLPHWHDGLSAFLAQRAKAGAGT